MDSMRPTVFMCDDDTPFSSHFIVVKSFFLKDALSSQVLNVFLVFMLRVVFALSNSGYLPLTQDALTFICGV